MIILQVYMLLFEYRKFTAVKLGKYEESCILYRLYCFGRLMLCLHCLHMFACLMILFEDSTIKYAKEFSMQCLTIIL